MPVASVRLLHARNALRRAKQAFLGARLLVWRKQRAKEKLIALEAPPNVISAARWLHILAYRNYRPIERKMRVALEALEALEN